jgi:hypothetical protein
MPSKQVLTWHPPFYGVILRGCPWTTPSFMISLLHLCLAVGTKNIHNLVSYHVLNSLTCGL